MRRTIASTDGSVLKKIISYRWRKLLKGREDTRGTIKVDGVPEERRLY